jgi:lipoprotein signal peptidase
VSADDAPTAARGGRAAQACSARSGRRLARWGALLLLVALDLWSKSAVFAWLDPALGSPPEGVAVDACGHLRYPLLGDWLALMLSTNRGMAFGQLANVPHLLVGGRLLVVLALLWFLARTPASERALVAALVLILSGALGNLHDNLVLPAPADHPYGEVRDFIDVYFTRWDWHFPTFNVADSCITLGALLLFALSFGARRPDAQEPQAPQVPSA